VIIKKELIEFIVKKIDRSYPRINQFLVKLNDLSIERKKKIDFKLINEIIDTME
jgi:chromosomal replication initiation ATPase DnaA